jgi:hypothetical protein
MTSIRRLPALIAGSMALGLVAGCGALAPSIPIGPTAGATTVQPEALGTAGTSATATQSTAPPVPVVRVSAAAQANEAQLGIQLYWHTSGDAATIKSKAATLLNYIVSLNANTVGITFPIYTDGVHPTHVYTVAGTTPTPATLRLVIEAAQARGLRVMLRPLIDETNIKDSEGDWRGSIKPQSISDWFASYQSVLQPYLTLAQETHVNYFVLGTELDSLMIYKSQWEELISTATTEYDGGLSYADNWGAWAADYQTPPAPSIGMDAYPELHLGDSATVGELTEAWTQWLENRSDSVLAKTVLQEVGLPAISGAYSAPAALGAPGAAIDTPIQTKWFTAACHSARELGLPGMYFWDVDSNANPSDPAAADPESFIGRGDSAIKSCFATGWGG